MSIDINVYLPQDTRIRDVAEVVGILAGLEAKRQPIDDKGSWACKVEGVITKGNADIPEMATIQIPGLQAHLYYHFEGEHGLTLSIGGQSLHWQAIAREVANFFGGMVDLNDSDSIDIDFACHKPRARNNPSDGQEWQDFEQAKFDLKPIKKAQIR